MPTTALVGDSISRIPGPPTGPSLRMTITCPALTRLPMIAFSAASSDSNTMALPENLRPSLPVIFATAPPGARFPRRIRRWLSGFIGFESGRMTSWPAG